MGSDYRIARARVRELASLRDIELAAAQMLRGWAAESVLEEVTSLDELRRGRVWVARAEDRVVGFAHVKVLEAGWAHLDELDVHPDHGRRGIGRRLVERVCHWTRAHGLDGVTLTTFREVPWNMPFYARLGFVEMAEMELSEPLRSLMEEEVRRGLDRRQRVAMRWRA